MAPACRQCQQTALLVGRNAVGRGCQSKTEERHDNSFQHHLARFWTAESDASPREITASGKQPARIGCPDHCISGTSSTTTTISRTFSHYQRTSCINVIRTKSESGHCCQTPPGFHFSHPCVNKADAGAQRVNSAYRCEQPGNIGPCSISIGIFPLSQKIFLKRFFALFRPFCRISARPAFVIFFTNSTYLAFESRMRPHNRSIYRNHVRIASGRNTRSEPPFWRPSRSSGSLYGG
jgi:hypothetical protein